MRRETCEICGYLSQLGAIEKHHIIPTAVTEQAGMPESQTVGLCSNCDREVHIWYSGKVTDVAYSPSAKQFRPKSWPEMVKEYQAAFNSFAKFKKQQKKVD